MPLKKFFSRSEWRTATFAENITRISGTNLRGVANWLDLAKIEKAGVNLWGHHVQRPTPFLVMLKDEIGATSIEQQQVSHGMS